MTSEAQKRAHAKLRKAREEAGKRTVSLWLSEPARKALDGLAKVHGSREAAVEAWLLSEAPAPVAKVVAKKSPVQSRLKGEWSPPGKKR